MIIQENEMRLFNQSIIQLDKAIAGMRQVARNMLPEALLNCGLGLAIQDYCDGINDSNVVQMKYTQIGSLETLNQSTEIVLFRIIQELAGNSVKHAAAKNVFIQVTKHLDGFTITIEDDGKGFDSSILASTKSTGLHDVRLRVSYLKGSFSIESDKERGTSNIVEIPLDH